jgi:hypothetical protein
VEVGKSAGLVATVYQLIDRGESERFREKVVGVSRTLGDVSVRVSGPSPCYAFG